MTARPIIFSAAMVHALLDGRKTMTRRLAWRKPPDQHAELHDGRMATVWQCVQPGDRLWVRESFYEFGRWQRDREGHWRFRKMTPPGNEGWHYQDEVPADIARNRIYKGWHLRPSIFMPRAYSRLTLVVTATKIERLQAISAKDCLAEGITKRARSAAYPWHVYAPDDFASLWRSLHGPDSWAANPEVVALTFRVARANIDSAEARVA